MIKCETPSSSKPVPAIEVLELTRRACAPKTEEVNKVPEILVSYLRFSWPENSEPIFLWIEEQALFFLETRMTVDDRVAYVPYTFGSCLKYLVHAWEFSNAPFRFVSTRPSF